MKHYLQLAAKTAVIVGVVALGIVAHAGGIGGPGISASPPVSVSNLSGLGTGVGTALGVNVGSAGAPVVNGGVLGTPSSGTLTNCTIPIGGVTGGTQHNVATFGASGIGTGIAPGTSGNVLTSDGTDWTSAAPSGGGFTYVYRTSDSSAVSSSTAFVDDGVLQFAVSANKDYYARFYILCTSNDTALIKLQLTGPASPTQVSYTLGNIRNTANAQWNVSGTPFATAFSTSMTCTFGSGTTNNIIILEAIIRNGSNAGTVKLQFSQGTSTGINTVINAGSTLMYQRMN